MEKIEFIARYSNRALLLINPVFFFFKNAFRLGLIYIFITFHRIILLFQT